MSTMRIAVHCGLGVLLASGLALPAAHATETVSGEFVLDGAALAPTEVAAFRIRDQFAPRSFQTWVMLTTSAVDVAAIAGDLDPYTVAINDAAVKDADWLEVSVDASGEVDINARAGGVQYVDSSGRIMGQQGSLVAECSANTAERVACRVRTREPVKTSDGPAWTLDVSFDAAVRARAPGQALPRDGGDPGKVFLALVKAADGDDLDAILAQLSTAEAEDYQADYNTPAENLENAKSTLGFTLPKKPVITGGELIDADTAVLEVEGQPWEDGKMLYLVEMKREGGRWGYVSSRIAGMLR
jgi:hypothetical protein